tara:strand:- start:379 stop:624 length:246 start_codon:yes stop_codon:yes gene_type:complete
MSWENVLKVGEERWKRYLNQRKKEIKDRKKYRSGRKPTQPKYKCAMCGTRLSRRGDTRFETTANTGLGYCKRCAEHRDSKR